MLITDEKELLNRIQERENITMNGLEVLIAEKIVKYKVITRYGAIVLIADSLGVSMDIKICPECKGTNLEYDYNTADTICSDCGTCISSGDTS